MIAPGYLDHAATTPVRPAARDAMLPWLADRFGNASGAHRLARQARRAVDDARDIVAAATGFGAGDVIFTGCGTEADNLAITGTVAARPGHVVTVATEHPAVLRAADAHGATIVGVLADGTVDLDAVAAAVTTDTTIVSVMLVNNETGVVNDLAAVGEVVRRRSPDALLHTDAIQSLCWLDLAERLVAADLVSLSAHKFGGPQGVGILAVRPGVELRPVLLGGGQERDRRAGTHNVAGVVGTAAAIATAVTARPAEIRRIGALRDRLVDGLLRVVPDMVETGVVDRDRTGKVAGNAHVCFPGSEAEALLLLLEDAGISASAGSSCASGAAEPSHVLQAMGVDRRAAIGSIRFSLGWTSTDADVDLALEAVPAAVERSRLFA